MFFKSKSIKYKATQSKQAFSIIEVMISVAIIALVTAIVVVRYGSFNSTVLLKNQAFEVALEIREAQSEALGATGEVVIGVGNTYGYTRGVYIDLLSSNQSFIAFLDTPDPPNPPNSRYDPSDEIQKTINLDPRFYISDLCVTIATTGVRSCHSGGEVHRMNILFRRPSYNAIFRGIRGNAHIINIHNVGMVEIILSSVSGPALTRTIRLNTTGLIEVR